MSSWQMPNQSAVSAYFLFRLIYNFCWDLRLLRSDSCGGAFVYEDAMPPLKGNSNAVEFPVTSTIVVGCPSLTCIDLA